MYTMASNIAATNTNGYSTTSMLNLPNTNLTVNTNGTNKVLLELDTDASFANLLKNSFFEKKPLHWKPVKFELVVNPKLTDEYQQIKKEFQSNAKESIEYEDKYGFIVENDAQVNEICQNGYVCQDNYYNVIGQSKAGVYLCKYPDVAIKFTESKKWPDLILFKMIIFKICYGKQTLALVRKDVKLPPICATPNFNSHMSVIAPKEKDDIEVQFDHSQIYLYEMEANKIPIRRPRHCLPYVVVSWLKCSGESVEWPLNFNESEVSHPTENGITNGHNGTKNDDHDANTMQKISDIKNSIVTASNPVNNNINPTSNNPSETTDIVKEEKTEKQNEQHKSETNGTTLAESLVSNDENLATKCNEQEPVKSEASEVDATSKQPTIETEKANEQQNGTTEPESATNSTNNAAITTNSTTPTSTPNPTTSNPSTTTSNTSNTNGNNILVPLTPSTTTIATTNPTTTTPTPASSYAHHKTNLSNFNKSTYSYRQNSGISPYLYAAAAAAQGQQQNFHPFGTIRLPYGTQPIQALPGGATLGFQANPYQAAALVAAQQQQQQQQQMFLVRTPNGLQYVTAAAPAQPNIQQQIAQAQVQAQLQAQAALQQQQQQQVLAAIQAQQVAALQQQQAAAAAAAAATTTYAAGPTSYQKFNYSSAGTNTSGVVNRGQTNTAPNTQIVYQAAPQPASSSVGASGSNNSTTAASNQNKTAAQSQQQQQQSSTANSTSGNGAPPTQSPKQQQQVAVANQQQQQLAQYQQYAAAAQAQAQTQALAVAQAQVQAQAQAQQQQQQQQPGQPHPSALLAQINQINQLQQMQAAYSEQPTYFAYAPNAAVAAANQGQQATSPAQQQQQQQPTTGGQPFYSTPVQQAQAIQQGYMLAQGAGGQANAAVVQQLQQQQLLQQLQQQQQQQQLYAYANAQQQLAVGGALNLNGFQATQAQQQQPSQPQPGQLAGLPGGIAGYQLIDYRQLQSATGPGGAAGLPPGAIQPQALSLEQYAAATGLSVGGVPRPRIVNLRHHPYQRN